LIRTASLGEYSKEYILSLEKIIDENGCWRSQHSSNSAGQVQISIDNHLYVLSRVVMCLWHDIKYDNQKVIARHKCNNRWCFNYEHIIPGTDSENQLDAVKAGTHYNASKTCCPKCKGLYTRIKTRRNGILIKERYCKACARDRKKNES